MRGTFFPQRFIKKMAKENQSSIETQVIRPLVVCGPSGSGKSSFLSRIIKEHPDKFGFSVSHTTRKSRPGEINNVHYNFTDRETMEQAIERGEFLENSVYSENLYGTSKNSVLDVINDGKVCIFDIDVNGVEQLRHTSMDPLLIFIRPPSIEELERRLRARKTETEESLRKRLAIAKSELADSVKPGNFHHVITNDNFEKAYQTFERIIFANYKFNQF